VKIQELTWLTKAAYRLLKKWAKTDHKLWIGPRYDEEDVCEELERILHELAHLVTLESDLLSMPNKRRRKLSVGSRIDVLATRALRDMNEMETLALEFETFKCLGLQHRINESGLIIEACKLNIFTFTSPRVVSRIIKTIRQHRPGSADSTTDLAYQLMRRLREEMVG